MTVNSYKPEGPEATPGAVAPPAAEKDAGSAAPLPEASPPVLKPDPALPATAGSQAAEAGARPLSEADAARLRAEAESAILAQLAISGREGVAGAPPQFIRPPASLPAPHLAAAAASATPAGGLVAAPLPPAANHPASPMAATQGAFTPVLAPRPAAQPPAAAGGGQVVPLPSAQAAPAIQPSGQPSAQPAARPAPDADDAGLPGTAGRSRMRLRHYALLGSFFAFVIAPVVAAAFYLWAVAEDQYASYLGFSVHRENGHPALALFSGLSSLSGSGTSSETDILYEFIFSQQLIADIDAEIDLRRIWSKPEFDPVFAYDAPGSIEDLKAYWEDMVSVYYDSATRLIEVRAVAFDPEDAQRITQAIYEKSVKIINDLNDISSDDSVRFAAEDLRIAEQEVRDARMAMTGFRQQHQLIDPTTELATQVSVLGALQEQLVSAQVERDLIGANTTENDPRLRTIAARITVIEDKIQAERRKLGISGSDRSAAEGEEAAALASIFAEFERLTVDREFAEQAYISARAAYEASVIQARRQSRYLAAHVMPTIAESSRFPERGKLLGLTTVFMLLIWSVGALMFYALRDRR